MVKIFNSFLLFIDFILSIFDKQIEFLYNKYRANCYKDEDVDYIMLITYGVREYTPTTLSQITTQIFLDKINGNTNTKGIISLFKLGDMEKEKKLDYNQLEIS